MGMMKNINLFGVKMKKTDEQITLGLARQYGFVNSLMVQQGCPTLYHMTPICALVKKGKLKREAVRPKGQKLYKYYYVRN